MFVSRQTAIRLTFTVALAGLLTTATACFQKPSPPSNEQIRDSSAQATRELKAGTKLAVRDAGAAAKEAAKSLGAVAAGVHEGLKSDTSGDTSQVDINSASELRLVMLPGIDMAKAHAIVEGRPYRSTHTLVNKGVLTREQYLRIASRIKAGKPQE